MVRVESTRSIWYPLVVRGKVEVDVLEISKVETLDHVTRRIRARCGGIAYILCTLSIHAIHAMLVCYTFGLRADSYIACYVRATTYLSRVSLHKLVMEYWYPDLQDTRSRILKRHDRSRGQGFSLP
jgi:hypothetical protein